MTVDAIAGSPDFTVRFDGPAVRDGRMPVRELAPALLALADLFQDVNATVNRDGPPVSLDIKATEQGSFAIDLSPVVNVVGHTIDMFASSPAAAAANLTGLITGTAGVISLLKRKRRGRREDLPTGQVRITVDDDTITYSRTVVMLGENVEVQRRVRRVIEPLGRAGVESVEFKRSGEERPTVKVTRADLGEFDMAEVADQGDELLSSSAREVVLRVKKPDLGRGKWYVHDGADSYWVSVADREFLARVGESTEQFGAGDELHVVERSVQRRGPGGQLKGERIVTEVLRHIKPPQAGGDQTSLT